MSSLGCVERGSVSCFVTLPLYAGSGFHANERLSSVRFTFVTSSFTRVKVWTLSGCTIAWWNAASTTVFRILIIKRSVRRRKNVSISVPKSLLSTHSGQGRDLQNNKQCNNRSSTAHSSGRSKSTTLCQNALCSFQKSRAFGQLRNLCSSSSSSMHCINSRS